MFLFSVLPRHSRSVVQTAFVSSAPPDSQDVSFSVAGMHGLVSPFAPPPFQLLVVSRAASPQAADPDLRDDPLAQVPAYPLDLYEVTVQQSSLAITRFKGSQKASSGLDHSSTLGVGSTCWKKLRLT